MENKSISKARKQYFCDDCRSPIEPGEQYYRRPIDDIRYCLQCYEKHRNAWKGRIEENDVKKTKLLAHLKLKDSYSLELTQHFGTNYITLIRALRKDGYPIFRKQNANMNEFIYHLSREYATCLNCGQEFVNIPVDNKYPYFFCESCQKMILEDKSNFDFNLKNHMNILIEKESILDNFISSPAFTNPNQIPITCFYPENEGEEQYFGHVVKYPVFWHSFSPQEILHLAIKAKTNVLLDNNQVFALIAIGLSLTKNIKLSKSQEDLFDILLYNIIINNLIEIPCHDNNCDVCFNLARKLDTIKNKMIR